MRRLLSLGLVAAAALARAGSFDPPPLRPADPSRPRPVRIGYFHGLRINLLYRAYVNGAFEKAGVPVEFYSQYLHLSGFRLVPKTQDGMEKIMHDDEGGKSFFGMVRGTEIIDAMNLGLLDGGVVGESSFVSAVTQGSPVVAVAMLGHYSTGYPGRGLILRDDVKITKPQDFKGRVFATRRSGPGDGALLREFFASIGLDPEKDVTIIDQVADSQQRELLEKKVVDGLLAHFGKLEHPRQLGDVYLYRKMDWVDPAINHALLVFNRGYVEKHPDEVQKVVDAYVRRIRYEHALPEEVKRREKRNGLRMVSEAPGLKLPQFDDPPLVRLELLEKVQTLLLKYGYLTEKKDLAGRVDNRFVAAAAKEPSGARESALTPPPEAVRIGYFHGGRTNMLYRAFIHGCFGASGVDVSLLTKTLRGDAFTAVKPDVWMETLGSGKTSGERIVREIVAGKLDGGTIGEASFLDALAHDQPLVAVALLGHQTRDHPGHAIVLRKGLRIESAADLKGKTLISRRAGPMDAALLREFVRGQGLDPDKDVKILPQVYEDDSISLLKEGKADGGFYHLLLAKSLVESGAGTIYRPMDWADPEMLSALLVFRRDFVRDHPDRVQKVVDAYVRRIALERALPPERKNRSGLTGLMMEENFEGLSIPTYDAVPRVRPELLREAQKLLLRDGALARQVEPESAVDNRFVDAAAANLAQPPLACAEHPRLPFSNALVIGWDGSRRERVRALLDAGKLPNLKKLIDAGRWLDVDVTTGFTDTKAGWTQILTGYDPQITGVYNNWWDYRAIPAGYTVPERLKAALGADGIATVFLSGKRENLGTRGPHLVCSNCERGLHAQQAEFEKRSKIPPAQRVLRHFDAEPYHLTHSHIDVFDNGLGSMDHVGARVLAELERLRDRRFFLFSEFEEPDEQGHRFAEGSPAYQSALEGDDAWLGRIQARLAELHLNERTLIYVVSDHGFNEGKTGHKDAARTFMATNDPAVAASRADRKDIGPTLLDRFGVDLTSLSPPLSGRSLLR